MEHLVAAIEEEEAARAAAAAATSRGADVSPVVKAAAAASATVAVHDEAMDVDDPAPHDDDGAPPGPEDDAADAYDEAYDEALPPHDHEAHPAFTLASSPAAVQDPTTGLTWQSMFAQLRDFHALGHRKIPPRMAKWMDAQRRRYKRYGVGGARPTGILTHRIRQLNSIDFDWYAPPSSVTRREAESESEGEEGSEGESDDDDDDDGSSVEGPARTSRSKPRPPGTQRRAHDPGNKNWTPEEDAIIDRLQSKLGNRWSVIAAELASDRTKDEVKNRWNWMKRRGLVGGTDDGADDDDDERSAPQDNEKKKKKGDEKEGKGRKKLRRQDSGDRLGDERRPYGSHVQGLVRAALEEDRQDGLRKKYGASGRARRAASRREREATTYAPYPTTDESDASRPITARRRASYASSAASDNRKKYNFPGLLLDMVNECTQNEPHVLEWTAEGDAFVVKDATKMPAVIGRYFRHSKYTSLQRMLYHYGFKRCSDAYDGAYRHPRFARWKTREEVREGVLRGDAVEEPEAPVRRGRPPSSSSRYRELKPPSSSSRVREHEPHNADEKKKAASKEKEGFKFERFGEGAAHPGMLFAVKDEGEGDDAATNDDEGSDDPATEPGPHDIPLSLQCLTYKRILFAEFQRLGRKAPEGDDPAVTWRVARDILKELQERAGRREGRLLRKTRGGGGTWYEEVDDEWALQKIGNDLRRRMESAKQWLNKPLPEDDDDEGNDGGPQPMARDEGNESSNVAAVPSQSVGDEGGDATAAAAKERLASDHGGKTPTAGDVVVSLKSPRYRNVLFVHFQKLGAKTEADDKDYLRSIARTILDGFRTEMGETGRFFRKPRGTKQPHELLDDDAAMEKITEDLRRRMDNVNGWLGVDLEALKDEDNDEQVPESREDGGLTDMVKTEGGSPEDGAPEPSAAAKPFPDEVVSGASDAAAPDFVPNWNLGSHSSGTSGVQYYKSNIGKYWVEQIVPRKTLRDRGPNSDRYFLSPDGRRFRSMAEVQRFLEDTGQLPKSDNGDESDEDEEKAGSYESEEEEEDDDGASDGRRSPDHVPCMCKKSKCLKLYCDCFNKERYCSGCACRDCRNTPHFQVQRDKAIAAILHRNPDAFQPRIRTVLECKCKKTRCLKKYCECFNAGKYCGDGCFCRDCENQPPQAFEEGEYGEESVSLEDGSISEEEGGEDDELGSFAYEDESARAGEAGGTISMKCPHCLDVKVFTNPGTAAASFSNHVRACGQKMEALAKKEKKRKKAPAQAKSGQKSVTMKCPHCLKEKIFPNRGTAAASFSNHVRACEQKHQALEKVKPAKKAPAAKKSVTMKCPHCLKEKFFPNRGTAAASFSNHVRACEKRKEAMAKTIDKGTKPSQKTESKAKATASRGRGRPPKKTATALKPKAETTESGVTMKCPHCLEVKHYSTPGTAAASFSNHVKACSKRTGQREGADSEAEEPEEVSPDPPTQPIPAEEKVSYTCPKCSREFLLSKKTAVASFSNHVRKCDPSLSEKQRKMPKEKRSRAHSSEDIAPSKRKREDDTPRTKGPAMQAPFKPLEGVAIKELDERIFGLKGKASDSPSRKPASPDPAMSSAKAASKPTEDDIVLSLKNPKYKEVMFATFQGLGKRMNSDENEKLHEMKHELFATFKKGMGDGRFFKSDRHMADMWAVDDSDALDKIMMDLKRRNESSKHWLMEEE